MTVLPTAASRGLAPSRQVLPNGVTVLSKSTSVTPAVTLNASIRAGAVLDPSDLSGVAHFVSKTIDRGTATLSADQIAEELDGRGVSLAATVTRQLLSLTCTCLVEDFDAGAGAVWPTSSGTRRFRRRRSSLAAAKSSRSSGRTRTTRRPSPSMA